MSIKEALSALESFQGDSLTESLSKIESEVIGSSLENISNFCTEKGIDNSFMESALTVKQLAGQINVIIHAGGILKSLDGILEDGEVVESVSLGAGNTGRKFDLETNLRVAEYPTNKSKYLYVVGTKYPMKFFNGGRALTSVLSRNQKILHHIQSEYGESLKKVSDYYALKKNEVAIVDVSPFIGR